MALRNEDYVAFLDESGEENLQVVAGVLVPARWVRSAERRWRDFIRHQIGSQSGRTEIHSHELLKAGERLFLRLTDIDVQNGAGPQRAGCGAAALP